MTLRIAAPLVAAIVAAAVACGGDDDDAGGSPTASAADPAATATATETARPLVAAELLPDLSALGLTRGAVERIGGPPGYDIAFAVYAGTPAATRAEVRVYPTVDEAASDFPVQVAGWKAPPQGAVFPVDPKNVDEDPLIGPDDSHAYGSSRADASGNQIWTDIYRIDRVIVIAHTLARDADAALSVRSTMAEELLKSLK